MNAADVKMSFARDATGRLVDVQRAFRGLACDCTCLGCGGRVVARQGSTKRWHFGHVSTKPSAPAEHGRSCGESALHYAAKVLLLDLRSLKLPRIERPVHVEDVLGRKHTGRACLESVELHPSGCLLEYPLAQGSRRLDALLTAQDGLPLGIEIKVTHAVDELKAQDLAAAGIAVLEIDLSQWTHQPLTRAELLSLVMQDAPRAMVAGESLLLAEEIQTTTRALETRVAAVGEALAPVIEVSEEDDAARTAFAQSLSIDLTSWPGWLEWEGWMGLNSKMPTRLFNGCHHSTWQAAGAVFVQAQWRPFSVTQFVSGIIAQLGPDALNRTFEAGHDHWAACFAYLCGPLAERGWVRQVAPPATRVIDSWFVREDSWGQPLLNSTTATDGRATTKAA